MTSYDLGSEFFDNRFKLVTSPVVSPSILGAIRAVFAIYALCTFLFIWIWSGVKSHDGESYLSYFTHLSWVGLCAYFCISAFHTLAFSRSAATGYPLQLWWKGFQYLHILTYSTVVTFPILVTIVYWALLASASSFESPYVSWSNISQHALNTVFALFEIVLTNVAPMPWTHLPVTILLLAGYLGVAYITYETQGFYAYSFLNPKKQGAFLAAYIIGIAVAQCVIFSIVRTVILLRERRVQRSTTNVEVETWEGVHDHGKPY